MPNIFASAKHSLRRGQYHALDLAQRLNALNRPNTSEKFATLVVDPQPDGATETIKVRFHPLFRYEFPSIVFDAVSNFRACLDQMIYTIAVPRGLPLPIGKDAAWAIKRIDGIEYLPPEILTVFRSFNPYKGGNDTLWALNELCNIKKHAARGPVRLGGSTFDAEAKYVVVGSGPLGMHAQTDTQVTFAVVLKHPEKAMSGQHPILLLDQIHTIT